MLTKIILAVMIGMPASALAQQPTAKYDRFKDITTHEADVQISKYTRTTPSIYFNLAAKVPGTRAINPTDGLALDALLLFDMTGNPTCVGTDVEVLADTNRFSIEPLFPTASHDDFAVSHFSIQISYDEALAFVNSRSVEVRMCGKEFRITDDQLAKLRSIFPTPQAVMPQGQPHANEATP